MENYLNVLEESLEKKLQILAKLQEYSKSQETIFQAQDVEPDKFDEYVDKKSALIDELSKLDGGFETLYQKVAHELQEGREKYAEQIRRLQDLVSRVTEESVSLQAQEARNKKLMEEYFRRERANIARSRKSSQAVFDYYKNMSQSHVAPSQFMDSKQ